jgi:hypothetical protein
MDARSPFANHASFVHHLALLTGDPVRLSSFYEGLLELERIAIHTDDAGIRSVWLSLNGPILMIERSEIRDINGRSGAFHLLALRIESERAAYWRERLAHAGIAIESESAYTIYFRDPDGNRLGLSSYPNRLG